MAKPKEPNKAEPLKLSVFKVIDSSLVPISVLFGFWLFSGCQITNTNKPTPPNFHESSDRPHQQHDAHINVEVIISPLPHTPTPLNLIQLYPKHSHSYIHIWWQWWHAARREQAASRSLARVARGQQGTGGIQWGKTQAARSEQDETTANVQARQQRVGKGYECRRHASISLMSKLLLACEPYVHSSYCQNHELVGFWDVLLAIFLVILFFSNSVVSDVQCLNNFLVVKHT